METENEYSDSEQEGLEKVLSDLNAQMAMIDETSKNLTTHVIQLFQRAKRETVDWMQEPPKPRAAVAAWCAQHGLSTTPTLDEFVDACLGAASFLDLETRIATFKKEDAEALWKGKRRISVFEIISFVPTLFH